MKSNIELLIESPEAMARFCNELVEHVTVVGLDAEIVKVSDHLRVNLAFGRECNLDMSEYLKYYGEKPHEWLNIFAQAIGHERGRRLGRLAGTRSVFEAREFARLQLANNAPFLGEAESSDENC